MVCRGQLPVCHLHCGGTGAGSRATLNCRKAKADLTICYLRHIEVKAKREERVFAVVSHAA